MYNWLRQKCENRSIAEMSIWYSITAVGSFIAIILLWGLFIGLAGGADDENVSDSQTFALLACLFLWLVFLIWLWIGLVRTAWKWSSKRLGTPIFKYLQIGFFVITIFTMLSQRDFKEGLKLLSFMLLAFDVVIVCMILNFLFLAWFARCKIPLRTYLEIGSIIIMVTFQVWIIT